MAGAVQILDKLNDWPYQTQIKRRATTGNVREVQKISVLTNTLNGKQNIRNCPFYIVLSAIICGYPL